MLEAPRPISRSPNRVVPTSAILFLASATASAPELLAHRPQVCQIITAHGLSFLKYSLCVGISRFAESRVLIHPHCGFGVLYGNQPKHWRAFVLQVLRASGGLFAISREWLRFETMMLGYRVYYMPNAIGVERYRPLVTPPWESSQSKRTLNVLYMGYLGQ